MKRPAQVAALFSAARADDADVLEALFDSGCECDWVDPKTGRTAFHAAAEQGSLKAVKVFLARGASTHMEDLEGLKVVDVASPEVSAILGEGARRHQAFREGPKGAASTRHFKSRKTQNSPQSAIGESRAMVKRSGSSKTFGD